MHLSIVIPAYNEEASLGEVLDALHTAMLAYVAGTRFEYEIIVVDDGSKDRTYEVATKKNARVIRHDRNRGYGMALKSGIAKAEYDWIAITDADGTYPPDTLPQLLGQVSTDGFEYEMVVGSRTGQEVHIPLLRQPAKWFLRRLAEYLTGSKIPDLNSGLRVFRKSLVERFSPVLPEGFSFTTTITIAAITNGYQVKYLPVNYYKRQGKSSIRPLHDTLGFLSLIIRLVVYFKPLNIFLPLSLMFIVIGLSKALLDFLHQNYFGVGSAIAILTGLQIGLLGLLADLILRRTRL